MRCRRISGRGSGPELGRGPPLAMLAPFAVAVALSLGRQIFVGALVAAVAASGRTCSPHTRLAKPMLRGSCAPCCFCVASRLQTRRAARLVWLVLGLAA